MSQLPIIEPPASSPLGDKEPQSEFSRPFSRPKWESVTDEMAAMLRQKTGAERLAIAHRMWRFGYQLVSQSVKNQNPTWSEDQIREEVARRMSHGAI